MRKVFLLLLVLSICYKGYPQELTTEEFFIPNGKYEISKLKDDIETKVKTNENKIIALAFAISDFRNYKESINPILNDLTKKVESLDSTFLQNDKKEDLTLNEDQIIQNIADFKDLFYNIPYRDEIIDIRGISSSIRTIISKFLNSSQILKKINNKQDKFRSEDSNLSREPVIKSEIDLNNLKIHLGAESINSLIEELIKICDTEIKKWDEDLKDTKIQIAKDIEYIKLLDQKINEEETEIDGLAIKIGLPLFCITILLLFLGPKIISLFDKTDLEVPKENSPQSVLLEISTVLLLTMSILILGLSDKIDSDVLGTLIGGISGYVLNRIGTSYKTNSDGK